jgi:Nucleotidyltransferase domain.
MTEQEQPVSVQARYERAVERLTDVLKQDRTLLAAILCGSLAYDEVWEKSDIDLVIVGDETHKSKSHYLVEDGINIHAIVTPRSAFHKEVEGGLRGAFFHSYIARSRLLYTHDESLRALYDDLGRVGSRDRVAQLLRLTGTVLWALPKAEKWFAVKRDLRYSFVYLLHCANGLASLEVTAAGEIPGREVIHQALRCNPAFFGKIYTDLIDGPKDEAAIGGALEAINAYLEERIPLFFGPVLEYLEEAGTPRSATEIDSHFRNVVQAESVAGVCEWLSEKGVIEKVSAPLRLSEKSRVAVQEAAFCYLPD